MSTEQLQVGDVVYVKTGTEAMTVNAVNADGTVEVIYQQGRTTKREVYQAAVLMKKQPRRGPTYRLASFRKGF